MPGEGKVVFIFLTTPLFVTAGSPLLISKKQKIRKQGTLAAGSASEETASGTHYMCIVKRPLVLYPGPAKKFTDPSFPKSPTVFAMTVQ